MREQRLEWFANGRSSDQHTFVFLVHRRRMRIIEQLYVRGELKIPIVRCCESEDNLEAFREILRLMTASDLPANTPDHAPVPLRYFDRIRNSTKICSALVENVLYRPQRRDVSKMALWSVEYIQN